MLHVIAAAATIAPFNIVNTDESTLIGFPDNKPTVYACVKQTWNNLCKHTSTAREVTIHGGIEMRVLLLLLLLLLLLQARATSVISQISPILRTSVVALAHELCGVLL